jgi:hypothetical protein
MSFVFGFLFPQYDKETVSVTLLASIVTRTLHHLNCLYISAQLSALPEAAAAALSALLISRATIPVSSALLLKRTQ